PCPSPETCPGYLRHWAPLQCTNAPRFLAMLRECIRRSPDESHSPETRAGLKEYSSPCLAPSSPAILDSRAPDAVFAQMPGSRPSPQFGPRARPRVHHLRGWRQSPRNIFWAEVSHWKELDSRVRLLPA